MIERECAECGEYKEVDEHHTSYEPEETIPLCRSCHQTVHKNPDHRYNPDDRSGTTTIEISEDIRDELKDARVGNETTYKETLARLLDDGSGGQLWTEAEIRDIAKAEAENLAQTRR